jgi:DNA-binding beta-propeller fold protein YncE
MHALNPAGFLSAALCCLLCTGLPAAAQTDAAAAQGHLRAATQAYRDGNLEGFTASLEEAVALNPFSLPTQYNLACGYARTGRGDEALAILRGLVAARVDFGMADDEDLTAIRDQPAFRQLVATLEENTTPVHVSEHHFTVDQLGLIPEGIAFDANSGRYFFGSMRTGDIYVFDGQGQLSRFATVQHEGKLAAIGLAVDTPRGLLWAAGASFDLVEGFDPDAPVRSGVFGFDLETGDLREQFIADKPINGFNDVAIAPSGDIYLTGDALSVVRTGSETIATVDSSLQIFGSNGIAVRPDGKRLFVTSYPVGIAAIDPQTGDAYWLDAPDGVTLYGIDGLYWHQGDLIGVQNGVRPWRLVRMQLNEDQTAVTGVRLIEFANDAITPTTGAIVGNVIHYIGLGPQPDSMPGHFPDRIAAFAGKTVVMTAPLE